MSPGALSAPQCVTWSTPLKPQVGTTPKIVFPTLSGFNICCWEATVTQSHCSPTHTNRVPSCMGACVGLATAPCASEEESWLCLQAPCCLSYFLFISLVRLVRRRVWPWWVVPLCSPMLVLSVSLLYELAGPPLSIDQDQDTEGKTHR